MKYAPSNAGEGMDFMARWCERCLKYDDCTILTRAMIEGTAKQWVSDDDGPRCTSFRDRPREHSYRCQETEDLFK